MVGYLFFCESGRAAAAAKQGAARQHLLSPDRSAARPGRDVASLLRPREASRLGPQGDALPMTVSPQYVRFGIGFTPPRKGKAL